MSYTNKSVLAWSMLLMPTLLFGASSAPGQAADTVDPYVILQRIRDERGAKRFYDRDKFRLDALPHYAPKQEVSGVIRIWGSNYIGDAPLARYWAEGFRKYHPNVTFEFNLKGAAIAIPGLVAGLSDLSACRKVSYEGLMAFQGVFHYEPLEIVVATGSFNVPGWSNATTIIVHKDNPITGLTMKQLDGIFGAERSGGMVGTTWHPEFARGPEENIRTWGQLGLTGDWKDKPIHVYGTNLRFNVTLNFSNAVLKGSDKWNEKIRVYADAPQPDGSAIPAGTQLGNDLARDPYGITYTGTVKVNEYTKALPLAASEGAPYVGCTLETVQNRTYPLYEQIYFYANRKPGAPLDPKVEEFLRYVLSREGQEEIAHDGKYLPLTSTVLQDELEKLR